MNGYFSKEHSRLNIRNGKIIIEGLNSSLSKHKDILFEHFTNYAKIENGFDALNTAFAHDGAFIHLPDNIILEEPIYILYLNGSDEDHVISQPRNLIITGKNSQLSIVESYLGLSEKKYFTNTLTEMVINENTIVDHYKIQNENLNSFHISKTQVNQERGSTYSSHNVVLGGSLVRNNVNTVLNGEGCETNYYGLYFTRENQHIDNHTLVDHAKPHCHSNEFYKGILSGGSRGVFNGKIIVRKDAQKTNAYQSNKNLLLSNAASIDTKPQLEIFADDVRCTHGATVGQIEDEAIFYLRSRGVSEENARSLLVNAFASDVIDFMRKDTLKNEMNKTINDLMKNISIKNKD